jgi:hypothetical protein
MLATQRITILRPRVIDEVFDDEVVVVHLETGHYYALNDTARRLWQGFDAQQSTAALCTALHATFAAERAQIDADVAAFVEQLVAEKLIELTLDGAAEIASPPTPAAPRAPYVAPQLTKYSDLQQLLLLDPIHDVDPSGWPKPAP